MVDVSDLELRANISTVEHPVCILAREEKKIRNKVIPLVTVQWNRQGIKEASWLREEDVRRDYPQLFEYEVVLYFSCFADYQENFIYLPLIP